MDEKEIEKILGENYDRDIVNECVDANRLAIKHFFGKEGDYRPKVINHLVKEKITFTTDVNTHDTLLEMCVQVNCPRCFSEMERKHSGSSGVTTNSTYKCPHCDTELSMTTVHDGLTVRFRE